MERTRIIVTHGTMGYPERNWFPWLVQETAKENLICIVPRYPTPEGQNLKNWLATFDQAVGPLRSTDILIGHSIGAAFVLRLLERSAQKIQAAFLVAGFARQLGNAEFDPYNDTFVTPPFDWAKIRASAGIIKCYCGSDDPYVPSSYAKELCGALCVEPVVIEKGGHLNADWGFTSFPLLLSDLMKITGGTAPASP